MSRGTAKLLSVIAAVAMIVLMLVFRDNGAANIVVMLLYLPIAFTLLYFQRCRHCGAWPRRGSFFDEYCPRCGERFDDWE